jgi:hypothetical protein
MKILMKSNVNCYPWFISNQSAICNKWPCTKKLQRKHKQNSTNLNKTYIKTPINNSYKKMKNFKLKKK